MVDEVKIQLTAGAGGDGAITFFSPKGKPSGGDGGHGGSIFAKVQSQMSSLSNYAATPNRKAQNGFAGASFNKKGSNGEDLILLFPPGCEFEDTKTGEKIVLNGEEPVLLCRGGMGGYGNTRYHATHKGVFDKSLPGRPGITRTFKVTLKLIADFGLVGKPNAGKSSLLNALTSASSKVADYPFTTITPALGVIVDGSKRLIIADIPGLIEGASMGRGLGIRFLKHIEKVAGILHCIPADSSDFVGDYKEVRGELEAYSRDLASKDETIIITKSDTVDKGALKKLVNVAHTLSKNVVVVSILDEESLQKLTSRITG